MKMDKKETISCERLRKIRGLHTRGQYQWLSLGLRRSATVFRLLYLFLVRTQHKPSLSMHLKFWKFQWTSVELEILWKRYLPSFEGPCLPTIIHQILDQMLDPSQMLDQPLVKSFIKLLSSNRKSRFTFFYRYCNAALVPSASLTIR